MGVCSFMFACVCVFACMQPCPNLCIHVYLYMLCLSQFEYVYRLCAYLCLAFLVPGGRRQVFSSVVPVLLNDDVVT